MTNFPFSMVRDTVYNVNDYIRESIDLILNQTFNFAENSIKNRKLPSNKGFSLYLENKDFHVEIKKNKVFLKTGDYVINKLHNHRIYFDVVDIKEDFINFTGTFTSCCYPENISIQAIKKSKDGSEEIFIAKYLDYGPRSVKKYLSIDWEYTYSFDVKIPINHSEESKISFRVVYKENDKEVIMHNKIVFTHKAQLSNFNPYLIKNSRILKFKGKTFYTFPYSFFSFFKNELGTIKNILFSKEKFVFHAVLFRLIYLITYYFMKNQEIWLFNDRPLYADDNGKYLFIYSIMQNDKIKRNSKEYKIKKYYVLDKNSKDFEDMEKLSPNILKFGSFKHKFLYMFAEKIITSHLAESFFNPFLGKNLRFYSGIINSNRYFLQHGVTMGDVSKLINKRLKFISLFSTISDMERNSIINGYYHFDEDIIQTLGFPRYDTLENKDLKKQILVIPTWRMNIKTKEELLNSEYFLRLNNLLNNKKLLDFISENDYKIVFRPHPEVIEYIDLFEFDDKVIISQNESYQKLFNESSLLITDYSSVFFDFAYLKKPVIYYQYADEYHYDKGYFDFKTNGFGDLIDNEEDLINRIIEYIENDCKMENKYKERVDNFFKFRDQNNCKRVYDWILTNF